MCLSPTYHCGWCAIYSQLAYIPSWPLLLLLLLPPWYSSDQGYMTNWLPVYDQLIANI